MNGEIGMKTVSMYMHGGSENHGCEAIVRSTIDMIGDEVTLFSNHPEMDEKYYLQDVCELKSRGGGIKRFSLKWFYLQVKKRIFGDKLAFVRVSYDALTHERNKNKIYLSIGGDNYCGDLVPALKYVNSKLNANGNQTVLWGCSIDPEYIGKTSNIEDLKLYKRIFAREKLTYDALVEAGLGDISSYHPDPAFTLGIEKWKLPVVFENGKVIGINISPYVQKNGSGDMVYENYWSLVKYILDETDFYVALIPHVVWSESDDRKPLGRLYDEFKGTGRVVYIEDQNCKRLKYCISNCYMLVTARTHASIAGYSTCVPTLVVGYSMKSKGIAQDLFGTTENYVVNAWDMTYDSALLKAFMWQLEHRNEIYDLLNKVIPNFIRNAEMAGVELRELLNEV